MFYSLQFIFECLLPSWKVENFPNFKVHGEISDAMSISEKIGMQASSGRNSKEKCTSVPSLRELIFFLSSSLFVTQKSKRISENTVTANCKCSACTLHIIKFRRKKNSSQQLWSFTFSKLPEHKLEKATAKSEIMELLLLYYQVFTSCFSPTQSWRQETFP